LVLNGHFAQINLCNDRRPAALSTDRARRCPLSITHALSVTSSARRAFCSISSSATPRWRRTTRENVLDHQRRQAHRRLVEDQQARLAEQGAVERQQLLFTAGEQPAS
jgi:hypothetical protein